MLSYENFSMLDDADAENEISSFYLTQLSGNFFISCDEIRYGFQNIVLEETQNNGQWQKQ
jgi:hypothetical protein